MGLEQVEKWINETFGDATTTKSDDLPPVPFDNWYWYGHSESVQVVNRLTMEKTTRVFKPI